MLVPSVFVWPSVLSVSAGVSQHLTALRAAGLVVTHRRGRALRGTRTDLAEALLSATG